jgi:N-sulfoglucosamine sulfohydrolase
MAKQNILFIIADDLGKYTGSYGVKSIHTPNIDKLAAQGTRFDMAFASTASCSASRSVIYTGLHTHQTGQYGHTHDWNHFSVFEHIESAPKIFNALGYQTGIVGKIHVAPPSVFSWEVRDDSGTRDIKWFAERVEAFFEQANQTNRPFYLTVAYTDPHRDATRGGFGNVETADLDITLPHYRPEDVEVPAFLTDVPEVRTELTEYYRSITRFDAGVGLLLKALEQQGLSESTLVIVTSDNGPPFLNSKTTLFEPGVCLPLIVKKPNAKPGVVNPNLISYIDFLPTLIDWAGAKDKVSSGGKSPPRLGRSFLPILESSEALPAEKWQQQIFGSHTFHEVQNYWPTRFTRTARFKYHRNIAWRLDFPFATDLYGSLSWDGIRNTKPPVLVGQRPLKNYIFRPQEELYDIENDPQEIHNLVEEKEFSDVLKELRKKTEAWQLQTEDPWLYRDGVSVVTNRVYETEGLAITDKWELDLENPGNRDVPLWSWPQTKTGS